MYRKAIEDLRKWKKGGHKPLIIRGARQTGKTWLMKEFGRSDWQQTVYINFDNNPQMEALFDRDLDTTRLIEGLELYSKTKIESGTTLLVFDEIQEVPKALGSLKYFNENAPQYHIVCAGSLLGIALHPGTSFPVGKVEFLDLRPLSFTEFLCAMGEERFSALLEQGDFDMIRPFKTDYIDLLKRYYFVGGMPEAVKHFAEHRDYGQAREIQRRILEAYEQDFSKHAPPSLVPRIRQIWNSIPSQLARENRKFVYGLVREGARAKEYESALFWLSDCGLVHQVHRVTVPRIPLKVYEDPKAFKLFSLDLGLLSCMAGLGPETLIGGSEFFTEFKGAVTEQYVLQEFKTRRDISVYYWSSDTGRAELDFVIDIQNETEQAVPVEVKAERTLQAKSLKVYREKFSPAVSIRLSMADYACSGDAETGRLIDLPLYAAGNVRNTGITVY